MHMQLIRATPIANPLTTSPGLCSAGVLSYTKSNRFQPSTDGYTPFTLGERLSGQTHRGESSGEHVFMLCADACRHLNVAAIRRWHVRMFLQFDWQTLIQEP